MKKRILSLLLVIVLALGMVPTTAFAAEETGITVYMTVFNKGEFCKDKNAGVMWQKPVTVLDTDADGKYSLDEALAAAHAACYAGGADGYATEFNAAYGSKSVKTLWGLDAEASGYYRNNTITNAVDREYLSEGDQITAFLYYDTTGWSDRYAFFTESHKTVMVGTEFELTLNYSGYDASWSPANLPVATAPIGVYNMKDGSYSVPASLKGENLFGTIYAKAATDIKGVAKLSFTEPGTYYVTAQYNSSNYSTYTDEMGTVPNYLVPPVCVVTVTDGTPVFSRDLNTAEVSYKVGDPAAPLSVEVSAPDGAAVTYQWYSAPDAESEGTAIDGAVESSYTPSTEAAGTAYYYVVASNTAEHTAASSRTPVKVAERAESPDSAKDKVISYIAENVTDPAFGYEWMILAQARDGANTDAYFAGYYDAIVKHVQEIGSGKLSDSKSTDNSRLILALSAMGRDAANVGGFDLVAPYADFDWVVHQGLNGAVFTLLALDSGNYAIPVDAGVKNQTTRKALVEYILSKECANGGWSFFGSQADPDMTAMALQSLALYQDNAAVAAATQRALKVLSDLQQPNGGYVSWGMENMESAAQVIIALTALGIDPAQDARFVKNGASLFTALLSYQLANGAFEHTAGWGADNMSTEQSALALVAYDRYLKGLSALYNIADLTKAPADPAPSEPEQPTEPSEPTQPTQPSEPAQPTGPSEPEQPTQPSEPEGPTIQPTTPAEPDGPQTGDTTAPVLLPSLLVLSCMGIAALAALKKKKYI